MPDKFADFEDRVYRLQLLELDNLKLNACNDQISKPSQSSQSNEHRCLCNKATSLRLSTVIQIRPDRRI